MARGISYASTRLEGNHNCALTICIRLSESPTEEMPSMLEARQLVISRGGTPIVDEASLAIREGEVVAIVGPSGSGKSSFLRLLNRLDEPTAGHVYIEGADYREIPPTELRRRVGYVPQNPSLRDGTVVENVTIGPSLRDQPIEDETVDHLLARVDLEGYAPRNVATLSGGEAQRVAIARTLINEPDVVLLDEPTASLDTEAEAQIEELLTDLIMESNLTCVLVTHDRSQARRLADRVAVFDEGAITTVGDIETVVG